MEFWESCSRVVFATRMGGSDKGLLRLGHKQFLTQFERLHPQVDDVVLNVNGDVERFGSFGSHVLLIH